MLKIQTILVLALFAAAISKPFFDLKETTYENSSPDWIQVNIPVGGASTQNLRYGSTELPKGWNIQNNKIMIPKTTSRPSRKYPTKIEVADKNQVILKGTIVISLVQNKVQLENKVYDYNQKFDYSFYNSGQYRGVPQFESHPDPFLDLITNLDHSTSSSHLSDVNQIFSKLPSYKELDKIINTADIFAITKTIQSVIESDLKCDDKADYLRELLGRIFTAVSMKRFSVDKLELLLNTLRNEIIDIENQIRDLQNQKDRLNLEDLQNQLRELVRRLEDLFNQLNDVEAEIEDAKKNVNNLQRQIETLELKNKRTETDILEKQIELLDVENTIRDLESKLERARNKRNRLLEEIEQLEALSADLESQISALQSELAREQARLNDLINQANDLRRQIANLEAEIKSLRDEINRFDKLEEELEKEIHALQKKLDELEKEIKKKEDSLEQTRRILQDLQRYIDEVQQKINDLEYSCTDFKPKQISHEQHVIVYEAPVKELEVKLVKEYGNSYSQGEVEKTHTTSAPVKFSNINVNSKVWEQNYGKPFANDFERKTTQTFQRSNDFSCMNNSGQTYGAGVIESITGRKVTARWNGRTIELDLGSCSKIQAVGRRRYPSPGQNIFWRGKRTTGNRYNVFSASCI